ncbi:type II secretion system protein GspM [Hydrogenothermus marinus]|uniref:General secretion pathway protein M n=1 Tax=Hydrogenothermus marinus TaxID=133270 RepID=A0A3M0BT93_9AQUI|nr:type II secretion system protein GspM [Hydrogenothermus marinus]RMA97745.1 general secretion pathway protein M [Hydrogenothermus marinus]
MKNLEIIFNSLEEREKYILFIGVLFVIAFVGIFFITVPQINYMNKLEKKLNKEIESYNELLKLAGIYASNKQIKIKKGLNIANIDKIATKTGIKNKVLKIKPITYQNKDAYELTIEKITPEELQNFINNLKKEKIDIYFISIENPRDNNKLNVRITIG